MTAWPIAFNFEPSSQSTPAIDISQGSVGSYTITAIPDPNYPNTVPADPVTGVRILPPQPIVTSLNVSNVTNEYKIDTTIWQLQQGYTAAVYFNSNDIFPFKQINLLLTDNTTRTFTTKAAVDAFSNSTSMPFLVTSCIPVNEQYVYRALSVTATSNSTTTPTLTRTFWIRMESDFTKTQDLLLALLGRSQSYIDSIAALNPPTKPFTPPSLLPPTKAPASEVVTQSYTSIVNRNEVSEPDFVLDELFRKKDPSLGITLLEEKSGKDIISLIDQQLAVVEVNMKEGIINNSIVPLSDIALLLEQENNMDCCTCDIPDDEPIIPDDEPIIPKILNWIQPTLSSDINDMQWISVTWSPELGRFVAVTYGGATGSNKVMYSSDGISWIQPTLSSDINDMRWNSVTWSPELGRFVAVATSGTGNRVMYSSDGINWIQPTLSSAINSMYWHSVTWSSELGRFVVVGNGDGNSNRAMYSSDGINWIQPTLSSDINGMLWNSVTWSPELSRFVAVAFNGYGNRVMYSSDGINWVQPTLSSDINDMRWYSVTWSPELSRFVAVAVGGTGNRVMYSSDGINWEQPTLSSDINGMQWCSVTWSPELSKFVAVANYGTGNRVMYSSDGINWIQPTLSSDINGMEWRSVTWSPELSRFVAVAFYGTGNRVMYSVFE